MFMRAHGKPTPQFAREIAEKTLLVGLGSTVFRDAKYTSHEARGRGARQAALRLSDRARARPRSV